MTDPNWHWDGTKWLHWDGTQWVTEGNPDPIQGPIPGVAQPGGPIPPGRSPWTLILGIVAGVLALALIGAVVFIVVTRQSTPGASPASPSPSPSSASPTAASPTSPTPVPEFTTYYLATSQGQAWGAGVKTKGERMSGWVGALQTDDLTCFNGVVANGRLTGLQVTPPYADSPGSKQEFSWPVSGSGADLRLVQIGSLHPIREVPLSTLNVDAGLSPGDTWQRQFDLCAGLTGGIS